MNVAELIGNLLLIILGWVACRFYIEYCVIQWIKQEQIAHEYESKNMISYGLIEQHGDTLYLYDKDTNAFMCQGETVKELAGSLFSYKNIKFAYIEHGEKIYHFVDGEVKEQK